MPVRMNVSSEAGAEGRLVGSKVGRQRTGNCGLRGPVRAKGRAAFSARCAAGRGWERPRAGGGPGTWWRLLVAPGAPAPGGEVLWGESSHPVEAQ